MNTLRSTLIVMLSALLLCAWSPTPARAAEAAAAPPARPKLVDVGAKSCIPCKRMAPILDELRAQYAGQFDVIFVDTTVKQNVKIAQELGVTVIPTQVFYDAAGKELFRHEGFYSREEILGKWKTLGFTFTAAPAAAGQPPVERLEAIAPDPRSKEQVCYMCDGDNDPRTLVLLGTDKGDVRLCSPHCYFILLSCLTGDKSGTDARVTVTDWATGSPTPAATAAYLYGAAETTGRPTVKAFAQRDAAIGERASAGGNLLTWPLLQGKELAHRCGFCDRACYPEDAALVKADGLHTWGCCSHCAVGVAARTGKDIEVHQRDMLTGQMIRVAASGGTVTSLDPPGAVAWFGQRKTPDGKWASAGCFHQGFFASGENLQKWLDARPSETGRQISIQQALSDKMKLSPQQIQKACKVGECSPK